jgi:nucleoid-associated protein EbfC
MNPMEMFGLMGKMKEMQARMKEAQDNIERITDTGEAGAGMVKATVNGKKQVIRIEIDPELFKPEDREVVQDLIVAAVNKANEKVEEKSKAELQKSTEGLLPNIPGLDLGNMFKAP